MHSFHWQALVVVAALTCLSSSKANEANETKKDYFVFLTTGKTTEGVAPEDIQKKQAAHLENFGRLAKLGLLTTAGPCSDPDKVTRGIVVINGESIANAETHFEPDPYVSEGYPFRKNLWGPVMNPSPLVVDVAKPTVASMLKTKAMPRLASASGTLVLETNRIRIGIWT